MASQVPRRQRLRGRKQLLALLALPVLFGSQARVHAASSCHCQVSYSVVSQWPGGFSVNLVPQSTGSSSWKGWTLTFTFPASSQAVTLGFNGTWTTSNSTPTTEPYMTANEAIGGAAGALGELLPVEQPHR